MELCQLLEVMPIGLRQLMDAVELCPSDYEDAVQHMSAQQGFPDLIITRDKSGYSQFDILVMTPTEFVKRAKE